MHLQKMDRQMAMTKNRLSIQKLPPLAKRSVQKAWGPKPIYIRWIYIAIVRHRLCYGKEILKLSRSQMRRLLELITGQNNLNYVQSKIYPGQVSDLCQFCEEEETFAHILNECPCFIIARREILKNKPISTC